MQSLMESEEGLFGTVLDDEQRIKLGRIKRSWPQPRATATT